MALLLLDDAAVLVRALADVPDDALSPAERGLADASGSDHRRLEIRAGRAAARELLASVAPGLGASSILRASHGAPRLDPPCAWQISLAHDRHTIAAAAAQQAIGVDVLEESRFAQAETVVNSRLSTGRAVALEGAVPPAPPAAALLWTAWEALGKLTGAGVLGGAMRLHLTVVEAPGALLEARSGQARVRWWLDGGALVALATGQVDAA